MKKYNPKIHHRRSIRLKGYDYAQAGLYFITICCQDRIYRFGDVVNGEMKLSQYGQIAHNEWLNTTQVRSNVELGASIIMPNHIHGIIHLSDIRKVELHSTNVLATTHIPDNIVELHIPNITDMSDDKGELYSPQTQTPDNRGVFKMPLRSPSQTIGAIVRGYKSSVTKQCGLLGLNGKLWQRNYYEHIIRNEQSYQRISDYIINNPIKWEADKFFKK